MANIWWGSSQWWGCTGQGWWCPKYAAAYPHHLCQLLSVTHSLPHQPTEDQQAANIWQNVSVQIANCIFPNLRMYLFKFQHHIAKTKTLTLSMLSPTLTTSRTDDQTKFWPRATKFSSNKSSQPIWSNEVMRCDFRLSLLLLTFILVLH